MHFFPFLQRIFFIYYLFYCWILIGFCIAINFSIRRLIWYCVSTPVRCQPISEYTPESEAVFIGLGILESIIRSLPITNHHDRRSGLYFHRHNIPWVCGRGNPHEKYTHPDWGQRRVWSPEQVLWQQLRILRLQQLLLRLQQLLQANIIHQRGILRTLQPAGPCHLRTGGSGWRCSTCWAYWTTLWCWSNRGANLPTKGC